MPEGQPKQDEILARKQVQVRMTNCLAVIVERVSSGRTPCKDVEFVPLEHRDELFEFLEDLRVFEIQVDDVERARRCTGSLRSWKVKNVKVVQEC